MSSPSTPRHEDKRERQCSSKISKLIEFEGHFSSCVTTKVVFIVVFQPREGVVINLLGEGSGKSGRYRPTGMTLPLNASQPPGED